MAVASALCIWDCSEIHSRAMIFFLVHQSVCKDDVSSTGDGTCDNESAPDICNECGDCIILLIRVFQLFQLLIRVSRKEKGFFFNFSCRTSGIQCLGQESKVFGLLWRMRVINQLLVFVFLLYASTVSTGKVYLSLSLTFPLALSFFLSLSLFRSISPSFSLSPL